MQLTLWLSKITPSIITEGIYSLFMPCFEFNKPFYGDEVNIYILLNT